ncbi:MAG: sodium:solute symporter family protein [Myxococcota bacterium]
MSFEKLGLQALLVYLLALLVLAILARRARRDASPSDHFLAARDLGLFVLFLTLYSTAYSGNSLLGYPGNAYRTGFSFIMATGFMMSIMVVFHALAPRLRPIAVAQAFITPGDWVRHRFAGERVVRALVIAVGVLMSIALVNFLLAQLKAMGHVASLVTGGAISYEWGVIGLAGTVLFYETLGGMRAVAWTDVAQALLMLVGLSALLVWLLVEAGGLGAVTQAVIVARPSAVAVPDATSCANWFSTIALLGLASVIYPQAVQRVYAARSGRALQRSFALMSFMPLVTTLVVTLIGIAAIPRIDAGSAVGADEVMPLLLGEWAAAGGIQALAAVLVFLGALAAIMSTADSCLLSLGSMVVRDLMGRSETDPNTTRVGKLVAALLMVAMVPLALTRELTLWRLIELKMELLIQCVPAFLLAIQWRGLAAGPTLVGLLLGTLFSVALTSADVTRLAGIHVGVVGLALNVSVAVLGSLAQSGRAARPEAQALPTGPGG